MAVIPIKKPYEEEKSVRIIRSALALFKKKGPKATSIEDIAQEAKIGKGTVYLYFKSKDEILSRISQQITDELKATLASNTGLATTAAGKLGSYIETLLQFWEEKFFDLEESRITARELMTDPLDKARYADYESEQIRLLENIIAEGLSSNELHLGAIKSPAATIFHMLEGLANPTNFRDSQISGSEKSRQILDLMLFGLGKTES